MWFGWLRKKVPRRTLQLLTCKLHGSHYYECLKLIEQDQLTAGDQLKLRREPSNTYDQYAIEILTMHNKKLGYLPQKHNRVVANLMDQHCCIQAHILQVIPTAWEPVSICVVMQIR